MRSGLVSVIVAAVLVGCPAATAKAPERPAEPAPVAHAACPWCIPVAIVAMRGAIAVRAATTVAAVVKVSRFAAPAFRRAVSRRRLTAAVKTARKIRSRGRRWMKRNWNRLGKQTRACIKGAGLLSAEQIIDGGFVTEKELEAWMLFYYPFMSPIDKAQFRSSIDWSEPLETAAAGCAVGWLAFDRS